MPTCWHTGVVYEATVVALPGTVCVVNASGGGGDAKVEALFSDMLQLRPDMTNALVRQQEVRLNLNHPPTNLAHRPQQCRDCIMH